MADTVLFELSVLHIKPKYIMPMLHELEPARKIWERWGTKYHGIWLAEAGNTCVLYTLIEWDSFERRTELRESVFKDAELIAYHDRVARYIRSGENYICKSETPVKPFGKQPIWIDIIKPKKIDQYAIKKLLEVVDTFQKETEADCHLSVVLNPFCYSEHVMFSIWEMNEGHKMDRVACNFVAAKRDPKNWQKMEEYAEFFEVVGSIIAHKIDPAILPPPK